MTLGRSELRSRLEAVGFRPSKTLGQNFLLDPQMARAIVRDARVCAGDWVLEVGPGAGALSVPLAELGVRLTCVELDTRLAHLVREVLQSFSNACVLEGDVLHGKHELAPFVLERLPAGTAWHMVANLPYSISGPLLAVLARIPPAPSSITALVQREVAERIVAEPDGAAWGALSARLASRFVRASGRSVPAAVFWPRPRVESRLVRLDLLAPAAVDWAAYDRLVHLLFQRRRKGLRAALTGAWGQRSGVEGALRSAGLDPLRRGESLSVVELWRLAAALQASAPVND
jgi:16S rRNA (adenine1518-N6/adenine1519-N6)-dimethyltransferase